MTLTKAELQKFKGFANRVVDDQEMFQYAIDGREFSEAIHETIPEGLLGVVLMIRSHFSREVYIPAEAITAAYISGLSFGIQFARYLQLEELYGKE